MATNSTPAATSPPPDKEDTGFFEPYSRFAATLRNWFMAYGIGGPVLFATNDVMNKKLGESGEAGAVMLLFVAAVVIQVLGAIVYKYAMWCLYVGELSTVFRERRRYKLSDQLSNSVLFELVIDLVTLFLFGWGTILALTAFLATTPVRTTPKASAPQNEVSAVPARPSTTPTVPPRPQAPVASPTPSPQPFALPKVVPDGSAAPKSGPSASGKAPGQPER